MNAKAEAAPLDDDDIERFYDPDDGIPWEELLAELPQTEEEIMSEPYAFSTGDYDTPEEGIAALWDLLCALGNGDSYEESIAAFEAAST